MKIERISLALTMIITIVACGNNKQENTKETEAWEAPEEIHSELMSLEKRSHTETVIVKGEKYTYAFTFEPSDSLPVIVNEEGQKYRDNTATLTIKHNGETFFHQVFTKKTFADFSDYLSFENSALIGFNYNYNKADNHDGLYFIATIGDPDPALELVSPVEITILPGNKFSLQPAEDVETEPLEPGLRLEPEQFE